MRFIDQYQRQFYSQFGHGCSIAHDPEWVSPCEKQQSAAPGQNVAWQMVNQQGTSFDGLEIALQTEIHHSIKTYYTSVWFPNLGATYHEDELELLGVWNKQEFELLQANLIGHALQQRYAKLPLTFFFALPLPDSEYCLAVENQTGSVVLEHVGKGVERTLEKSLGHFLDQLHPLPVHHEH